MNLVKFQHTPGRKKGDETSELQNIPQEPMWTHAACSDARIKAPLKFHHYPLLLVRNTSYL